MLLTRLTTSIKPTKLKSTFHFNNNLLIKRTLFEKISPHPKNSLLFYKDFILIMGIFAITGSTSVYISRPLLNNLFGLKGSLKEGPWSYRISSVLLGLPTYSLLLFTFSNLFGKNVYFYPILKRMWSRFLPKKWSNKLTMLK